MTQTPKITTRLTDMFGIRHPIICGSMMWLGVPRVCEVLAEAGGLGTLTSAIYKTEDDYRAAVVDTKRRLDGRPYMVGLTIKPSVTLSTDHYAMYLRVCLEERVPGMEISGLPLDTAFGQGAIDKLNAAGIRIFHKVGSLRHGLHAQKVGYDGVYAAGFEEAGHPLSDDVTTMVLTPRLSEALSIPVITVGGVGDGRTMAAALTLGASGVMMVTRFLATSDCAAVHDNFRHQLVEREAPDATVVAKTTGMQCRVLNNAVAREIKRLEGTGATLQQLLPLMAGQRNQEAWVSGDVDHGMTSIGQSMGLIHDIPSTAQLLERMVHDAQASLSRVQSHFTESREPTLPQRATALAGH